MVNLVKSSFISSLSFSLRISSSFLLLVYFYNFYDSTINETVSIAYFYALIGIIVSDFGIQNYIQSTYSENDYDNDQLFSYLLSFKIVFILFLNIVLIFSILLLSNLNIQDVIIIILIWRVSTSLVLQGSESTEGALWCIQNRIAWCITCYK